MTNAGYIATMPREEQDRAGKIRMFPSGKYVDPFDLKPEDIEIADIAHHLSIVNRYTGGSPFPVSVASHSVRVCYASVDVERMVSGEPRVQLHAQRRRLAHLLHDAAEAYLNDLASPVKKKAGMEAYIDAHHRAEKVIFAKFGLDIDWMPTTKELDDADFRFEVRSFYEPHFLQNRVVEIPWRQARQSFLDIFDVITERIRQLETA